MNFKRKIIVVLGAALIVAALVYGFMPRPVPVETAKVAAGPLRVDVEDEGRTRVVDRYTVTAPVAGELERITLKEGDPVKKGSLLAVIVPKPPELLDPRARAKAAADVEAASSAVNAAEKDASSASAEARYAEDDLGRKEQLYERGIIAKDELEAAQSRSRAADAALGSAHFAVEVARHQLDSARTALKFSPSGGASAPYGKVPVRSPVEGSVLRVFKKSAGAVADTDPIIEIGDPDAIEVEVDVLSDEAVRIKPGMRVLFERWGGPFPLEGRVRVVEPSGFVKISALGVEEQRVWVISDIVTPKDEWRGLGDGYRVEANFIVWERLEVLQAPESALFRHKEGWAVFVVKSGRARLRDVEPGERNGIFAEIKKGLSVGETVITHPDESIKDGGRVEVPDEG